MRSKFLTTLTTHMDKIKLLLAKERRLWLISGRGSFLAEEEEEEKELASLALHHFFESCFDRRPLALDNAIVDRMAIGTIGHN